MDEDALRHAVRQIKRFQFDTKRYGRGRATGMCSVGQDGKGPHCHSLEGRVDA
jgi:hypothetical protein